MFSLLYDAVWWIFISIATIFGVCSFGSFLLMQVYQLLLEHIFPKVDFSEKYRGAAVVVGGSTGIGRSICEQLAEQHVPTIVIAALDDDDLDKCINQLSSKFAKTKFVKCGINLGSANPNDYMKPLKDATDDLDVRILFLNAAFILFGLFSELDMGKLRANCHVNALSSVEIAHHFVKKMSAVKFQQSFIGFTCSAAALLPGPTCLNYGPTKAFLLSFATTLQAEVRDVGIHVMALVPGPVATGLFAGCEGLPTIEGARAMGVSPRSVAEKYFFGAGRILVWQQGVMTLGFNLANRLFDFAFIAQAFSLIAQFFPDHVILRKRANAPASSSSSSSVSATAATAVEDQKQK